ncbi:MAG: Haloacid dehalogenase domain protein hydrolase [Myxococcaceae bacterium]|nr:Haloacid dehalogenase domain protein hydrolase [Myxococcaceae bacterium]
MPRKEPPYGLRWGNPRVVNARDMPVRLVVTDMDNTMYSWVDYIVPAMEALVAAVCQATGFPRIKVVQSLKTVYSKYESNEYPFALQESTIYAEFPEFGSFDKLIIEPARMAFAEARKKYMKPYKGVISTLEALKERKIPVVALTDAPRNPAEQRAKRMGFDQFLGSLYTLPGFQLPASPEGQTLVAPDILQKEERGLYRAACDVIELPRDYEKPNPRGLLQICQTWSVDPAEVLVIGDSLKKDIGVAREVGAIDCWAEYGTYVSLEYRERLDIISAASVTRRHAASVYESGQLPLKATHVMSSFSQILDVIDEAR